MKKLVFVLTAALFSFGVATAQDTEVASHDVSIEIPLFAIVDIETSGSTTSIELNPSITNLEAGDEINFGAVSNNDLWLNYTAITEEGNGNNNESRQITAQMSTEIPGLDINLTVADDASAGEGTVGSPEVNGALTLTDAAQKIITGIGSCYTGDGASSGHRLTYTLEANDYSALMASTYPITVTYTITDE